MLDTHLAWLIGLLEYGGHDHDVQLLSKDVIRFKFVTFLRLYNLFIYFIFILFYTFKTTRFNLLHL